MSKGNQLKKVEGGKGKETKQPEVEKRFPEILKEDLSSFEILDFKERNVEIAKDQKEYRTIPTCVIHEQQSRFISKFLLSEEDLERINRTKSLWHIQFTFGQAMQPILLTSESPFKTKEEQKKAIELRLQTEKAQAKANQENEENEVIRKYDALMDKRNSKE